MFFNFFAESNYLSDSGDSAASGKLSLNWLRSEFCLSKRKKSLFVVDIGIDCM